MNRFPKEVKWFILDNYKGKSTIDLTNELNKKLGTNYTYQQIRYYKKNHKLCSGVPGGPQGRPSKVYPEEVVDYIFENYKGTGHQDMADQLNERFGTNYTKAQIKSYYANYKLNSGLTGHFPKGHIPPNKGRKGYHSPGSEKGWFREGRTPHNHEPVGTEAVKDGYLWRKIADPDIWRQVHILNWEEEYGEVPDGHLLTFLDGDTSNVSLDNLALATRAESARLTHLRLRSENPEFTKTGILIAKIHGARKERKRK